MLNRIILIVLMAYGCVELSMGQTTVVSSALSNGAGMVTSASYQVHGTIGQTFIGSATSASYFGMAGFDAANSGSILRLPDLQFASTPAPAINPTSVAPGAATAATFTVTNTGDVDVTATVVVRAYLSVNTTFETSDIALTTFNVTSTLAKTASFAFPGNGQSGSMIIPASTAEGAYQILFFVDPDNTITEKNELATSNIFATPITISNSTGTNQPLTIGTPSSSGVGPTTVTVSGGTGTKTVTFFHRGIIDQNFTQTAAVFTSGTTWSATIDDSMLDALGIEFYFTVTDAAASTVQTGSHYYIWRSIAKNAEKIPFASGFDGTTATYQMFSIPYNLTDKTISSVFDPVLRGYDATIWRMFHYDNGNYLEYTKGLNTLEPGEGYWFNEKGLDGPVIPLGAATTAQVSQKTPFTIALSKGWNQLGNPYPFSIRWDSVQNANPAASLGLAMFYESGTYSSQNKFDAWKGAFVFSDNGGVINIPVTSGCNGCRTLTPEVVNDPDQGTWQFPMQLQIADQVCEATVGMNAGASLGKDKYDQIALPRFIDYAEMSTSHPEFFAPDFSGDIVPSQEYYEWNFTVSSNQKNTTGRLSWDASLWVPKRSSIILIDLQDQTFVNLKSTQAYSFPFKQGRMFRVVYSRDGKLPLDISTIGAAYPNPFQKEVAIPVLKNAPESIVIAQIYDLTGRRIRTITQADGSDGIYEIHWDGRDEQGLDVAAGTYISRVSNNGELAIRRLVKTE